MKTNNINSLFKNAIDKKELKKALQNEKSKKEILNILNKVRY